MLARHGEPALSRKVWLSADEYRAFWSAYEGVGLMPGQTPPAELARVVETCQILLSSTRPRSIESARHLAGARVFESLEFLIEAPLPPPNLPRAVRLPPSVWGFLARFWWWFFNHHQGEESRAAAEARADRAAALLIGHAERGEDVAVLAHGFFNHLIGRALRDRGWRLTKSEGYKYWSMRRWEQP